MNNKIFILVAIVLVAVAAFLYKAYSVNLETTKGRELIQAQQDKESAMLEIKNDYEEQAAAAASQAQKTCFRQAANSSQQSMTNLALSVGYTAAPYPSAGSVDAVLQWWDNVEVSCESKYPKSVCSEFKVEQLGLIRGEFKDAIADCYRRFPAQ